MGRVSTGWLTWPTAGDRGLEADGVTYSETARD